MLAEKLSPFSVQKEKCISVIIILYLYNSNTSLPTKIQRDKNMQVMLKLLKELFKWQFKAQSFQSVQKITVPWWCHPSWVMGPPGSTGLLNTQRLTDSDEPEVPVSAQGKCQSPWWEPTGITQKVQARLQGMTNRHVLTFSGMFFPILVVWSVV